MPFLETPPELADRLANLCGVYGAHDSDREPCRCRVCFCVEMAGRIRESVANEKLISAQPSLLAKPQRISLGHDDDDIRILSSHVEFYPGTPRRPKVPPNVTIRDSVPFPLVATGVGFVLGILVGMTIGVGILADVVR